MNRDGCDEELLLVAALQTGESTRALDEHLATCASCAEAVDVARSIQDYRATISALVPPPAAKRIWRNIQAGQRRSARRQATRALNLMWSLAAVYLGALMVCYLPALWQIPVEMHFAIDSSHSSSTIFAGLACGFAFIVLGALYLLFIEGRSDFQFNLKEE